MTVQVFPLPPAFRTVVDPQVPPATMENPVPATVGEALNANGPPVVPVAVFVTVTKPVFVVVLGVPVAQVRVPPVLLHNAGEGGENVSVAPVTWKALGKVPDPLPGTVTVTVLAVNDALWPIAQLAVTVVEAAVPVTTTPVQVMLPPFIATAFAPNRLLPLMVTGTIVPRTPDVGLMPVSVGTGAVTVNVTVLVVPSGVVTLTVLVVVAAVEAMVKTATTWESLTTPMSLTVTPVPDTLIADAPVRCVPLSVTFTNVGFVGELPRRPEFGMIEVRVGLTTVR